MTLLTVAFILVGAGIVASCWYVRREVRKSKQKVLAILREEMPERFDE